MNRLSRALTIIAVVEAAYTVVALTPPSLVEPLYGFRLNADGHWTLKLLGVSLAVQAAIAWLLRHQPHRGIAAALAAYQFGSATIDWMMWLTLRDDGIFATTQARVAIIAAIPSHYLLGLLLTAAIVAAGRPVTSDLRAL
ncbi:hypothetical protein Ais01nite_37010 [Asanoa ishikariensis]|uniref:Uncharacterized protein n=1 Tax=Asanoa ishikariensis TaxID=137265 RepID=A0A1H3LS80_9ACTN|nr:hypothetical protein [Asanoa ishikariensis]GIF65666.1 hypothetical protein Ais01nite_37010 [Asanoa ishikariensis]SDY67292.1 hypothetical protein SAMN05421684_0940 [Asanoa ishikariensis]